MRRIEGPTRSMPLAMVWLAGALLLARLGLYSYEHRHPPAATEEIQWQSVETVAPKPDLNGRPYFIWFTSAWSQSAKHMEDSTFSNKKIVRMINEEFLPVRVIDRKKEDKKNSPRVQASESRYRIYAFPTMVTALGDRDHTEVQQQSGFLSSESTLAFLKQSLAKLNFQKGIQLLIQNKPNESAAFMALWLKDGATWEDIESVDGALYLSVAYLFNNDKDKAREVLNDARAKAKIKDSPLPLLNYIDQSPQQLLDSVEDDPYQLSAAHYFAAARLLLCQNDINGAITNLKWIQQHGTGYKKLSTAMLDYIAQHNGAPADP